MNLSRFSSLRKLHTFGLKWYKDDTVLVDRLINVTMTVVEFLMFLIITVIIIIIDMVDVA